MYATAYRIGDPSGGGTQIDNLLVRIDRTTGAAMSTIGATGFGKLFGVAYDQGVVFGFTHDGTGDVITINPKTGVGTRYGSFKDTKGAPIRFAGAGVNAMVEAVIP